MIDLPQPQQNYYYGLNSKGLYRLAYTTWGNPNKRPLICVHGLSRNGRDFDELAAFLAQQGYWVICPDVVGRGLSDWFSNPSEYQFENYLKDLIGLINRLNVTEVDWLGTSMGGLLGIALASLPNTPIKRLIVNDIGPTVEQAGLDRLKSYIDHRPTELKSIDMAEQYFRYTLAPFGKLSNAQWRHLTKNSIKPNRTGGYALRSDPAIKAPTFNDAIRQQLWQFWQNIRCPTLVIRGSESDLLSEETVIAMKKSHRIMQNITFEETGHAPSLMVPEQIDAVYQWLSNTI